MKKMFLLLIFLTNIFANGDKLEKFFIEDEKDKAVYNPYTKEFQNLDKKESSSEKYDNFGKPIKNYKIEKEFEDTTFEFSFENKDDDFSKRDDFIKRKIGK